MSDNVSAIPTTHTTASVSNALHNSAADWLPGDSIVVSLARFGPRMARDGVNLRLSFDDWTSYRRNCAQQPWPSPGDKDSLPAEVGALLSSDESGRVRRRVQDVDSMTWLFVDSDRGESGAALKDRLTELEICFLMTESATSRLDGNPTKWHLYLPLAEHLVWSSRGGAVDARAMLQDAAQWWRRARRHAIGALHVLGGMSAGAIEAESSISTATATVDDQTADSLNRMSYVPHAPADGRPRYMYSQEGRCLRLLDFLQETSFTEPVPTVREQPIAAGQSRVRSRAAVHFASAAAIDGNAPTPAQPTPGETTGTLLFRVLDYFGLVGPLVHGDKHKVLCPWRQTHTRTDNHDPEGFLSRDTSVTAWLGGEGSSDSHEGGFKCQHNGASIAGQCSLATAADVLRWARNAGCPSSVLPDREESPSPADATTQENVQDALESLETGNPRLPPSDAEITQPDANGAHLSPSVPQLPLPLHRPAAENCPPPFPGAPVSTSPPQPPQPQLLPGNAVKTHIPIVVGDLIRMRDQAVEALSRHSAFFKVVDGDKTAIYDRVRSDGSIDKRGQLRRPWMRKTGTTHLTVEITSVTEWTQEVYSKKTGPQDVPVNPDKGTIAAVLASGYYPIMRELRGIVTAPVFRADGTLLQSPGYDRELCVIYEPAVRPAPVSADPSREDLRAAMIRLRYVLCNFPFVAPERAFGVWLSIIFTKLLRFYFQGSLPMITVSSGMPGGGKGKYLNVAAIIAEGQEADVCNYTGDDAEDERVIGAAVADEAPFAILDNIRQGVQLASTAFEGFLTTPRFATRKIGTSDRISSVKGGWNDTMWFATGCRLRTSGDMCRRVLRVDIDDRTGHPEHRDVKERDLEGYCRRERRELLHAALTLLTGYFAAKKKRWSVALPAFASFDQWEVVREAVVWCGLPDPFLARGRVEDDEDLSNFGFLVGHLLSLLTSDNPHKTKRIRMTDLAAVLKRDGLLPVAQQKLRDFRHFMRSCDVKYDARDEATAASSMGKFMASYAGKDWVGSDGAWRLIVERMSGGSTVRVERVG